MDTNDDRPVGGAPGDGGDAGDALSPPERDARMSRNPMMVAVIVVTVIAVTVFVIIASVG